MAGQSDFDEEYDDSVDALVPKAAVISELLDQGERGEFGEEDLSKAELKPDHESRPLWICPESRLIIMEAYSPVAEQAQDFLITIAEPVSRPTFMHEYKLTPYSLYAAVSVGLQTRDIIDVLNRLCKMSRMPDSILKFITTCTASYGKIKLVLKQNKFYVESEYPDVLQMLLRDPKVQRARLEEKEPAEGVKPKKGDWMFAGEDNLKKRKRQSTEDPNAKTEEDDAADILAMEDASKAVMDDEIEDFVHSFEIKADEVENVKKHCNEINYPMLEEYDFRNDNNTANLDIDLKPTTMIRPYQEKSLSKMFGNGRARSGIIVLPCGAGKTLVGITATCTVKKSCLVLCTSSVSCHQWRREYLKWSNISERQIACFTADNKQFFSGKAGIVVSTYTMVANTRKRAYDTAKIMDFMQKTEWGLLILDEVHVVPANVFRRVLTSIAAHTKLGLTATLVREDDKIADLNFLIGPKLYEANWMDLAQQGHIAMVQCAEVWCPMTADFYREYMKESSRKKRLLYAMNPNKFQACQYLIQYHEDRGDKIIVFSDNVYALKAYALKMQKPFIYGATSHGERTVILSQFQHNPAINTIFLSKIGDTSIDLPEATCLIQVSSHYGSRRQEAQRLGRILRAKKRAQEGFNAFFYSLVSTDTEEMYYSQKRQQFLIDQGYAFKVITHLDGIENTRDLAYPTKKEQLEVLQSVLMANEKDVMEDDIIPDADYNALSQSKGSKGATRKTGNMKSLSGADNMAYIEYNRPVGQQKSKGERHTLFKQWYGK